MSLASLSEAIRKELTTLGIPTVLEMAVVSTTGRVLYTDLGKAAMNKISPFYDSLLMMGLGDNLSLALDSSKTIVASRVSNKAILIVITDKKIGIVLTKMSGVSDKFGRLLDELVPIEESKVSGEAPPKELLRRPEPGPPPPEPSVEEIETQAPPPIAQPPVAPPRRTSTKAVAAAPVPAPVAPEPAAVPIPKATSPVEQKAVERVIVPFLTDLKILEKCQEKDRKYLELFDGSLSLNDISRKLGVTFFDALQVANKYKNMGRVDMKEVIRG